MGLEFEHFSRIANELEWRIIFENKQTAEGAIGLMRDEMREPKSGMQWPGLPNQSSAPGEPPAYQFGDLWDSFDYEPDGVNGVLSNDSDHAADLEFGSRDGAKAARPFMAPAITQLAPEHWARLAKALQGR